MATKTVLTRMTIVLIALLVESGCQTRGDAILLQQRIDAGAVGIRIKEQQAECNDRLMSGRPCVPNGMIQGSSTVSATPFIPAFPHSPGGGAPFARRPIRDGQEYGEALRRMIAGEPQDLLNGTAEEHLRALKGFHPELAALTLRELPGYVSGLDLCSVPGGSYPFGQLKRGQTEVVVRAAHDDERFFCDRSLGRLVISSADCGNPAASMDVRRINHQQMVAISQMPDFRFDLNVDYNRTFETCTEGTVCGQIFATIRAPLYGAPMAFMPAARFRQTISNSMSSNVTGGDGGVPVPPAPPGGPVQPAPRPTGGMPADPNASH